MKTVKTLICLTLVAVLATSAIADDNQKKGKGKKRARKSPTATQRLVAKIELTDEQKTQIGAINKQFSERFTALRTEMASLLTPEQKKAQRAANKAAKEAGQKPREARKAVDAALNLTEEQQSQRKEFRGKQQQLNVEIITALKGVLTAEQQELLPKQRKQRDGKGKKGKKKRKKKDAA